MKDIIYIYIMSVTNNLYALDSVYSDNLDSANAGTMAIGSTTATKVEIGNTSAITEVQGSLTTLSNISTAGYIDIDEIVECRW